MIKKLLFFLLLFAPAAYGQGYVSATEGATYANGSLVAELLPPTNGNVGTTHTFFDLTGYVVVYGLSPGKTYGFWATDAQGTNLLYGRVTVTGAAQDITANLFPVGGASGFCNIGLAGPGGIFTVTGTPASCNGVLTLITTGTSGGVPCFTDPLTLGSSAALTVNTLPKGGGAGACVSNSTVTDDGVLPTRTPDGDNIATKYIVLEEQNTAPGTAINLLACISGTNVTKCPVSPAAGTVVGIAESGVGAAGTVQICVLGRCPVIFDNQSTRGDSAIPSTTVAGDLHDTGGTAAVSGYNFFVDTTNAGAGTLGIVRPPGDIANAGGSLVSCLTTLGDIWTAIAGGVCDRLAAPTTPDNLDYFLTGHSVAGAGVKSVYKQAGVPSRTVTTTPNPVVYTDRAAGIIYNSGSPIAVPLPQSGTTNFANKFVFYAKNIGAGDVTITPTISTMNGVANLVLHQGDFATIEGDDTNYNARVSTSQLTAGSGITFTRAANGVTIAAAGASVASTRRVCMMPIGADNGTALVDADLGPQRRLCFVPYGATIVEVTVAADAGTPNVIVGRNRAGTIANITSAALATAGAGVPACSNVGGTTGLDGTTTCSATLQNTAMNQGDWLELVSGTAGGTAKRMSIAVTYTVQ